MLKKSREVERLLPPLARTDREVKQLVDLAMRQWASGDGARRLVCDSVHGDELTHALDPDGCYISDEDAQLVEKLAESAVEVLQWAVEKGWGWRREGGGRVRRKYVRKAGVTG